MRKLCRRKKRDAAVLRLHVAVFLVTGLRCSGPTPVAYPGDGPASRALLHVRRVVVMRQSARTALSTARASPRILMRQLRIVRGALRWAQNWTGARRIQFPGFDQ